MSTEPTNSEILKELRKLAKRTEGIEKAQEKNARDMEDLENYIEQLQDTGEDLVDTSKAEKTLPKDTAEGSKGGFLTYLAYTTLITLGFKAVGTLIKFGFDSYMEEPSKDEE